MEAKIPRHLNLNLMQSNLKMLKTDKMLTQKIANEKNSKTFRHFNQS